MEREVRNGKQPALPLMLPDRGGQWGVSGGPGQTISIFLSLSSPALKGYEIVSTLGKKLVAEAKRGTGQEKKRKARLGKDNGENNSLQPPTVK